MKYILPMLMFILLAWQVPASASGMGFVAKRPMGSFTAEDSEIFRHTLFDVLDHQPDGKAIEWVNEASGHSGKIKAVASFEKGGQSCRTIRFLNRAGGVTGQGTFDFCKQADGTWKVVP